MKRPERVKIIGKVYKVLYVPEGHDGLKDGPKDKKPGQARIHFTSQTVYIQEGLALETEQDALWHEIKHGVEDAMDVEIPEDATQKAATGELAVMKDNPKLLSFLRKRK
jgi:hypothetical protein